jgi:effector-binding domain-containing protein
MRAFLVVLVAASCGAPRTVDRAPISGVGARPEPTLGDPTRVRIEANWKERLEQPYVYLEKRGDYRDLGEAMNRLLEEARALGLRGDGPPFALFFDDPGRVALSELRARVCFPVGERPARTGALEYELLPRAMVVYARVPGAHTAVAHAYPALFSYLRELGWRQGGPVREVYLLKERENSEELVTEVQIPWTSRDESPSPQAERN